MPIDEETLLMRRFADLAARAEKGGYYVNGPFLSPADQTLLAGGKWPIGYTLQGGYEGAERALVLFGEEERFGYPPEAPAHFLKIAPKDEKFAETLSHRDYLGALMNLGVTREVMGDILIEGKSAYLYCMDSIAPYLKEHLTRVRHTDVILSQAESLPPALNRLPEPEEVVAGSLRLDALVAAVYRLSRAEAARLFERSLVSVDGRTALKSAAEASPGQTIAVRGYGRFTLVGQTGDTRKGRARVLVRVWR